MGILVKVMYAVGAVGMMLLQIGLFVLQVAAIYAGLEYWLEWPTAVCFLLALALVFLSPLPFLAGIAGILGAHYAWDWPWWLAILLFFGMTALLMGISFLVSGTVAATISLRGWLASRRGAMSARATEIGKSLATFVVIIGALFAGYYVISNWHQGTVRISDRLSGRKPLPISEDHALYEDLERFLQKLKGNKELQDYVKARSGNVAALLAGDGIRRLDDALAEKRVLAIQSMIASADTRDCAHILRINGSATPEQSAALYNALGASPQEARDAWFAAAEAAALAVARNEPYQPQDLGTAQSVLLRAIAHEPPEVAALIEQALAPGSKPTDRQLCEGGKALFRVVLTQQGADRRVLIRALSSG